MKKYTFRNNSQQWGLISILFHWLSAIVIIGLFILGLWMVELDYYSSWYHKAPSLHKSIGMLLLLFMLLRLVWRLFNPPPKPLESYAEYEIKLSSIVHSLLYIGVFTILITGYFTSTIEGDPVSIFSWFEIPSFASVLQELFTLNGDSKDLIGELHLLIAIGLILLSALHTVAALKHHYIDKDITLSRMFGKKTSTPTYKPTGENHE